MKNKVLAAQQEDAARRLGWSVSKTKSALFRARNRLREQLKKEGFL